MGRPPCCDKVGMKKGPWTPEEDILLLTYVQQYGPGNWKAVPTSTGLKRCSKSCRLRWTNYLRPGIKRGSFTDQEEKMIIQLQALLGNKWAAISSYLPERTDNDIKNYWNTHLKKKLTKLSDQSRIDKESSVSKGQWESRLQVDITTAEQAFTDTLSFENTIRLQAPAGNVKPGQGTSYASSTGNIARLLKGWTKTTKKYEESKSSCSEETPTPSVGSKSGLDLSDTLFGFEAFECSNSDEFSRPGDSSDKVKAETPLSMIESWLLDDQIHSFDENPDL